MIAQKMFPKVIKATQTVKAASPGGPQLKAGDDYTAIRVEKVGSKTYVVVPYRGDEVLWEAGNFNENIPN